MTFRTVGTGAAPIRRLIVAAVAALLATAMPAAAAAQWGREAAATVGLEWYRFGDAEIFGVQSLSLITVPFAARTHVGSGVFLDLRGAHASGRMERRDGSAATLAGFTDTYLRVTVPLLGDALTLAGSAIVPTGETRQSGAEAELAGALAADLLPFRISNWGAGGGLDLAAAVAAPVAGFGVGAGASYRMAREFEPLAEGELAYRPGNQFNVHLAVDRTLGTASKLTVQVSAFRFSDDALEGQNLYRSGDRTQALATFTFPVGRRSSGVAFGGWYHRSRATDLLHGTPGPAQDLILAGGGVRARTALGVLLPGADLRVFRSEDGMDQGYIATVGAAAELPLGRGPVFVVPVLRARVGRIGAGAGADVSVSGGEAGIGLRIGVPGSW